MSEPRTGVTAQRKAHVFVVEDDLHVLRALVRYLDREGYTAVGFDQTQPFSRTWKPVFPLCVMCALDGMRDGLSMLRWLREQHPLVPVIGLAHVESVRTIVAAMRLGAVNVLEKPLEERDVLLALQEVWEMECDDGYRAEELLAKLSPREREVLDLVATGMTSRQIAFKLGLSKKTVDVHRAKVLRKLEADSIVDLVRIHGRSRRVVRLT